MSENLVEQVTTRHSAAFSWQIEWISRLHSLSSHNTSFMGSLTLHIVTPLVIYPVLLHSKASNCKTKRKIKSCLTSLRLDGELAGSLWNLLFKVSSRISQSQWERKQTPWWMEQYVYTGKRRKQWLPYLEIPPIPTTLNLIMTQRGEFLYK